MNLRSHGRITRVIFWWLGLIFFGWSAAVMAANPQVAVYQDTTFNKASDFNYVISDWFENDPNNLLPWPENRISEANGNGANVSISAEPGHAGAAVAAIGVQFDWDLGSYTWEEAKNWELSVTIDFAYAINANYVDGNGSANACLSFNILNTPDQWYDLVGYEAGSPDSHSGTYSETINTTFEEMPTIVCAQVYCQAHSAYTTVHNSSANLTINSITFHPDHDYSKYDFIYYYNDNSGDYYTGYVYAPTSFHITGDADNQGFIQVGTHLTNEPQELGSNALGGYYDITGFTDGYDSSYDKKEYITSYYDGDTSKPSYTLYTNSEQGTAGNESNPVKLFVSDRTKAHETGYVYDPLVPDDDAYFGNADVCYDFSPNSSEDNNFLVTYIGDLPYWSQPSSYPGACSEVAGAVLMAYLDGHGYPNLITTDWQNDWPDGSADSPFSYYSLITTLVLDMHWSENETKANDVGPGLQEYAASVGYNSSSYFLDNVASNRSLYWDNYMNFINAGHLVILFMSREKYDDATGKVQVVGHAVVGRGYWNNGYILADMGWGLSVPNQKFDWNRTSGGLTYQEYCITNMLSFYP